MNGVTLQALRRLLFFTRQEAATLVAAGPERPRGVTDRTWRLWEAGEVPVPEDVVSTLRQLCAWRRLALDTALGQIDEMTQARGAPSDVVLLWYASLDDWLTLPDREAVVWRPQCSVVAEIAGKVTGVELRAFDAPAYAAWLGTRKDGEVMRSRWAVETP